MPYLRFLYFITALLALECFASNARSQCSSTCGGPCFSNSSIISFGQTYWSCGKQATCESVRGVSLYDSRLFVVDLSDDDAYHIGLLLLSLRRPAEFSASTVQGHPVLLTVGAHSGLG